MLNALVDVIYALLSRNAIHLGFSRLTPTEYLHRGSVVLLYSAAPYRFRGHMTGAVQQFKVTQEEIASNLVK